MRAPLIKIIRTHGRMGVRLASPHCSEDDVVTGVGSGPELIRLRPGFRLSPSDEGTTHKNHAHVWKDGC